MRLNANGRQGGGANPMRQTTQSKIEQVFHAGRISRREHLDLTSALLADGAMTDLDRYQINQIIESVQSGKLELVD